MPPRSFVARIEQVEQREDEADPLQDWHVFHLGVLEVSERHKIPGLREAVLDGVAEDDRAKARFIVRVLHEPTGEPVETEY